MDYIGAESQTFVPASHEDPLQPGVLKRVIATHELFQQGRVQMLNWARLPAGNSFQPHYHEDMQEAFVLISGQVQMVVNQTVCQMKPGDTVLVSPGEIHQIINHGEQDAEYIVFGISAGKNGKTVVA